MNKKESSRLIFMAAAAFPHLHEKQIAWEDTVTIWAAVLEEVPYDIGEKALLRVLKISKFFPAPSEILNAAIMVNQLEIAELNRIDAECQEQINSAWYAANRTEIEAARADYEARTEKEKAKFYKALDRAKEAWSA